MVNFRPSEFVSVTERSSIRHLRLCCISSVSVASKDLMYP